MIWSLEPRSNNVESGVAMGKNRAEWKVCLETVGGLELYQIVEAIICSPIWRLFVRTTKIVVW